MSPVLNAFRHHRNPHRVLTGIEASAYECSTPFDIIGILTRILASRNWLRTSAQRLSTSSESSPSTAPMMPCAPSVLNAFRHHRNPHPVRDAMRAREYKCSTPFDIIGILTD